MPQIRNWDLERGAVTRRLRGHTGWVWCLETQVGSPAVLLSGATDGRIKRWDLRAGEGCGMVGDLPIATPTAQGPNQGGCPPSLGCLAVMMRHGARSFALSPCGFGPVE